MSGNNVQKYFIGDSRPCPKCGMTVTVTEGMYRRKQYMCNSCESKRAVIWAQKNKEKKRASNNRFAKDNSANRAARTASWRANHPEKRLAHQAVQTALRNGSLSRMPCEVCGADNRVHAHHDDYSKPLAVVWLCHSHHMERHHMLRARDQEPS